MTPREINEGIYAGGPLSAAKLDAMQPGIFAEGLALDNLAGLHLSGSGRALRWVAVRGAVPDWAIYAHFAEHTTDFVRTQGDKVGRDGHITRTVPCDEDALARYRR